MFKTVSPKIDFPELEKHILDEWISKNIVRKYLQRNEKSAKRYKFLDGPITANNPMGVHHAWGRTYKDLWQRFWNMRGYKQRFQNGFDCQGLWVEVEVEKELGIKNKRDIENLVKGDKKASIAKFVDLCKERVLKYSGIQTEQSKRLGYFMDWDHSYYTMSDENNYMIWHFLKVCYDKGWIYKGSDSVPWCPRCQTAISEHEMLTEDYKELTHETVFVKLPITTKGWEKTSLIIWTTTPWTVPANVSVGINTKFTYGLWNNTQTGEKLIILYKNEFGEEVDRVMKNKPLPIADYIFGEKEVHDKTYVFEKEIPGEKLVGLTYKGPFDNLTIAKNARQENPPMFHTVVDASDIVVSTEGTGLLHVAPGAGKEDFDLGKKLKLPVISAIDDEAFYVKDMDEFSGKNAKKHPEIILDHLRSLNEGRFLLKTLHFTHRYPACWRCKTELVWKITQEWYIAMDIKENGNGQTLREQMEEVAKKIDWHPIFGLSRELDWLSNMHDWLISKKNRYWGLALPVYECQKCQHFEVIGGEEELEKRAVSGWEQFSGHTPHKPYIDEVKIKCSMCGETVSRVDDVGNVWLDAGIVPFSTLVDPVTGKVSYTSDKKYWQEWFPFNFITESFPGQFKNWFYSLIAMSTVLEKTNSFATVLGFASMLAEDGRPMHKSWGNMVEFHEGADKIGVDVMRWMFALQDPEQNLLFGYKKADETRRRFHLILWNIYNFFVTYAQVDNWAPVNTVPNLSVLDRWITSRLHSTIKEVTSRLAKYDASSAALAIELLVNDLSLWYVRRSRDRVGPAAENQEDKNAFYATTYSLLTEFARLLSPFLPFLAESIYTNLTDEESVHLADWPVLNEKKIDKDLEQMMSKARKAVEEGHAKRKVEKIKVRIPMRLLTWKSENDYKGIAPEVWDIVLGELNVKNIKVNDIHYPEKEVQVSDEELRHEGQLRDLIRTIQEERKKLGYTIEHEVKVTIPKEFEKDASYIKKRVLASAVQVGDTLTVK